MAGDAFRTRVLRRDDLLEFELINLRLSNDGLTLNRVDGD